MSDWVRQERDVSGPGEDWIKAEREHERKMAEIKRKQTEEDNRHKRLLAEKRTEKWQVLFAVIGIVAVILGIAYFVWNGVNQGAERAARLELACIESGGSWTSLGGTGSKSCYYIGNIEERDQ